MTQRAPRRRITAEPVDARPKPRVAPARREEPSRRQADRKFLAVLLFPTIDNEMPLGPSPNNPMGEGSEETAARRPRYR